VEELVAAYVLHRLDSPELTAALIAPDTATGMELAAELDAAEARMRELAEMFGAEEIDRKGYLAARRVVEARITKAKRGMAERVNARGLADLMGTGAELRASWDTLNLTRQSAILRSLIDHVVILPGVNGARALDPNRVQPVWIV
jgi:hypothetical protein